MHSTLPASGFTSALFGFDDKHLEAEFQVCFRKNSADTEEIRPASASRLVTGPTLSQAKWAHDLGWLDRAASTTFSVLMAFVTARLFMDGATPVELVGVCCGATLIHGLW